MTIEQICCVCFGAIVQMLTFAFGILIGVSLATKKGKRHGCHCNEEGIADPRD